MQTRVTSADVAMGKVNLFRHERGLIDCSVVRAREAIGWSVEQAISVDILFCCTTGVTVSHFPIRFRVVEDCTPVLWFYRFC